MAEVAEILLYHVDELLETFIGESDSECDSDADEEDDFGPAIFYPCHVTDPFHQTLDSDPRFQSEPDMGSDYLNLGHGLGLHPPSDFFPSNDPQPFEALQQRDGLRITGFDSDSEPESDIEPYRWDCLRIGDEIRDLEPDPDDPEDLEWEEVVAERQIDEQDLLRMLAADAYVEDQDEEVDLDFLISRTDVAWEVLMAEGGGLEEEAVEPGQMSEYEILASQIDNAIRSGNPPAAKGVVESLPTIVLSAEKEAVTCAICKDEMAVEEKVTKLSCGHFYHKDCIVPWLGIRNSCPVCRFELPTDDTDYENWKDSRGSRGIGSATGLVELFDRLDIDWDP
ncbi:E3 ubiquitin-protein ligase RING1 [Rhynchospora pubera]|uniref:RING-type E3 ubiquitin transferase n=1 Tax=Rhynchospora pubera TaxID=906938 RepID=A0AAV8C0G8_9POAL|nr:E3 ubiquitin-protein ligase RING1 [Rhynchospora pubera]